jgi:hypothetical protein
MYKAADFTKLEHGPYGTRWSYTCDEHEIAPTVQEAEAVLGVKLASNTIDASGERTDGLCETVYFAADEFSQNTVSTYQVQ